MLARHPGRPSCSAEHRFGSKRVTAGVLVKDTQSKREVWSTAASVRRPLAGAGIIFTRQGKSSFFAAGRNPREAVSAKAREFMSIKRARPTAGARAPKTTEGRQHDEAMQAPAGGRLGGELFRQPRSRTGRLQLAREEAVFEHRCQRVVAACLPVRLRRTHVKVIYVGLRGVRKVSVMVEHGSQPFLPRTTPTGKIEVAGR